MDLQEEMDSLTPDQRMKGFEYPIPGQGLTNEPGRGSWEQPPELVDLDAVSDWFWNRLTDAKIFKNTMRILDAGVPIDMVATNLVAQAAMNGKFSIDMALLVTPIVVVQMRTLANMAGASVSYTESKDVGVDPAPLAKMFAKKTGQSEQIKQLPKEKPNMDMGLLAKEMK